MIAFTYDHESIKVYYNGKLDTSQNYNPFPWDKPIYDAGEKGADFTIAQRNLPSWENYPEGQPKNKVDFGGLLGGVALYKRALTEMEMEGLYKATLD